MNRKLISLCLLLASAALALLCLGFSRKADELPGIPALYSRSTMDPWQSQILESRDQFHNLIVSIVADDDALYGEENGLLSARYRLQGMDGEQEIQVFVYDSEGGPLIAQRAGLRISGATSRNAIRKSFRVIARKEYDQQYPKFTYDLWGGRTTVDGSGEPIEEYSSFILHSVRLAMDSTGVHNSVGYRLAEKAGIIDASPTTPAAVYINGVYQGAYFIIPAKTDNALAELYHIEDKDDIEVVSVFEEEKTGVQTAPEVLEEYLDFVEFLREADLTDPETVAQVEAQLDVRQCLQYYAVNLLLANGDWLNNNLRVWRCKDNGLPYQDGKWRFFLFDLDWIGSFSELAVMNVDQAALDDSDYNILPDLLENPDYLEEFLRIVAQMEEDAFNPDTIEAVFAGEEARMLEEAAFDFQSDAFAGYMMYSVNSTPVGEEEYLTLEDRQFLIEDLKAHLLETPALVDARLEELFPR
ncbi:MAG: CotH kinase family protein [Eubacteriales bacterium]|nr:CotH kinase family protein [Eubacteriales bacterium]